MIHTFITRIVGDPQDNTWRSLVLSQKLPFFTYKQLLFLNENIHSPPARRKSLWGDGGFAVLQGECLLSGRLDGSITKHATLTLTSKSKKLKDED
jgi:hypothetical protein